jgi:single-stranded-DNA-specific exonuclease
VDNIPAFKRRFEEITAEKLSSADITPKISVDALIDIAEINRGFVTSLRILEPFGESNRQPIFVSRGLFQKSPPMVVGRRHLKILVDGPDGPLDAIGFDMAERIGDLRDGSRPFDLAYVPRMNSYKGTENIQLVIKDFKPSEGME